MELFTFIEAHKYVFEQLPNNIAVTGLQGEVAWASDDVVNAYGFNTLEEIIGKRYTDMQCKFSEDHMAVSALDNMAILKRSKIACLGYHKFTDGWKVTLCNKSPLYNREKQLIGLITQCNNITPYHLVDINRYFMDIDFKNQFAKFLDSECIDRYKLSKRQQECLFHLIRGKSSSDISAILGLSPRTVESYVDQIKSKMYCRTRSELIEKSLAEGLMHHYFFARATSVKRTRKVA